MTTTLIGSSVWLVPLLFDVSLKVILLAVIAGAGMWLFRVRATSVRHRVWTAVQVGMLAIPLLVAWSPTVPLPTWAYPDLRSGSGQELVVPHEVIAPAATPITVEQSPMRERAVALPIVASAPTDNVSTVIEPLNGPSSVEPPAPGWTEYGSTLLAACYALGVLFFGGRLLIGLFAAGRLVRTARPVELSPQLMAEISRVRVLESARVRVPLTVGWLQPAIVLPSDWSTWDAAMLAAVLAHEQAHVRRRDSWVALATQVNRAIYWFHPLSWFLARRLTSLAEEACDDAVIESLGDRTLYARHLLAIAGRLAGQPRRVQPLGVAMAARPAVEDRIESILDDRRPLARRLTKTASFALVAIAAPLVILAAALRADERESTAEPIDSKVAAAESQVDGPTGAPNLDSQVGEFVLNGRISDEFGSPVTDATIELTGSVPQAGDMLDNYVAKTDVQGRYQFEKINAAGEFSLRVTSTRWVGITDWKTLPRMNLTPASRAHRDFTLQMACQIGVLVVDQAGNPVKNAQLYAASLADDFHGSGDAVRTSEFGTANIGGLKPSKVDYIVGAYHDDYGYAKRIVSLRETGALAVEKIELLQGVDVPGVALCSDGKPANGWKVYALPSWWQFGISHRGSEIQPDGSFTLTHIVPDAYDLNVHIPEGGGTSRVEVAATAAKLPPAGGRVELNLRSVSPQSMVAIGGKIRYLGEQPPNGFWISANSVDRQTYASTHVEAGAKEFLIPSVPPGTYRLSVEDTRIEPITISDVAAPTADVELKIRGIEQPELRGTVVQQDGGEPIARFRVRVEKLRTLRGPNYTQEPRWYEFDDASGTFKIEVPGPGVYRVLVAADGFAWTRSEDVNSDEDASHNIRVELAPGATLTGTVVNDQGEPIDGAAILPLSKASGSMGRLTTQFATRDGEVKTVDGEFTLEHLMPGKETLKVSHPDYGYVIVENIDVPAAGGHAKPITLTRGGIVRGQVFDPQGKPQANVTLFFQDNYAYSGGGDDEVGRLATAVTDSDGFYEVRGLPEQLCYAHRQEEWTALGVVRSAIFPKNGATRTLDLGGTTPLIGRLLVNGKPLANTRLQLGGENPNFGLFKAFAQTTSDGSFTFWGPPAGEWTLYYLLPGRRSDWCHVRIVETVGEKLDLGTIDCTPTQLVVRVIGGAASEVNSNGLSLVEYNPVWPFGNQAGVVSAADTKGTYLIDNVSFGKYELICRRADGLELRQQIEVRPGKSQQQFTMEWPPGNASVGGEYHNADGRPQFIHPPNLWSKDRRLHRAVMGDQDNQYRVEDLPAGEYYLAYKDTRDAAPAVEFSLVDGEQKSLDLTPDVYASRPFTGGMLTLRVFTDQGAPLSGCNATLVGPGGTLTPSSSQMGRITFVGAPGEYRMTVRYPGFETIERDATIRPVNPGERPKEESQLDSVLRRLDR